MLWMWTTIDKKRDLLNLWIENPNLMWWTESLTLNNLHKKKIVTLKGYGYRY